uniref:serine C-palmitoyltransferase n=1 Tax=Tetradesmus obliquus TaxID=3088 RepID=A0A383WER8_TETOB|eukprot:jgi/Sobl393_1/19385/SZX76107.1
MGQAHHPNAPWYINAICTWALSIVIFCGRIRDLFWRRPQTRKGYADLSDQREDFYNRRMYRRIHDCYNRPISSAPGAWIDVMERVDIDGKAMSTQPDLVGGTRRCLNLGSYNYLGFAAADEYCTPRVLDSLADWGVSTCSSRTEAGTSAIHRELEQLVAEYIGQEDAITFGMGFATNAASIPAIAGPGSLVLSDALNHTSIVAGVKASGAKVKVFRHNDMAHLEKLLRWHIAKGQPRTHRPWKKVIIMVEGIYSMEGETTLLRELVALKRRYKAYLYLDEAHSIGCMGASGRGLCEHAGVDPREVDVLMGTFTKSFGSAGGYIAGSKQLIAYLRRHCPAHLYATSMAPGVAQQIISAIRLMRGEDGSDRGARKIRQLKDNSNYFRRRLQDMGLHVLGDWDSPIMPIMVYHLCYISGISRRCLQRRIAMVVVGFPATALLMSRCRVCISASHTKEDLDYALEVIYDVCSKMGLQYAARQLPWPWCWLRLLLWPPAFGNYRPGDSSSNSSYEKGSSKSSSSGSSWVWAWLAGSSGKAVKAHSAAAAAGKAQPLVTAAA